MCYCYKWDFNFLGFLWLNEGQVVAMRAEGRSYRWIARELGISKNTVADIVQRHRANA